MSGARWLRHVARAYRRAMIHSNSPVSRRASYAPAVQVERDYVTVRFPSRPVSRVTAGYCRRRANLRAARLLREPANKPVSGTRRRWQRTQCCTRRKAGTARRDRAAIRVPCYCYTYFPLGSERYCARNCSGTYVAP